MAKIFVMPKSAPPPPEPDYQNYDAQKEQAAEEAYLVALKKFLRSRCRSPWVGEVVRTPVADGHATYMVCSGSPFAFVHLQLGDAWRATPVWERGYKLIDLRIQVV